MSDADVGNVVIGHASFNFVSIPVYPLHLAQLRPSLPLVVHGRRPQTNGHTLDTSATPTLRLANPLNLDIHVSYPLSSTSAAQYVLTPNSLSEGKETSKDKREDKREKESLAGVLRCDDVNSIVSVRNRVLSNQVGNTPTNASISTVVESSDHVWTWDGSRPMYSAVAPELC